MIHHPFVTELQRGAAQLRLPNHLISPLHIRPDDTLYSVMLKPDFSKSENPGQAGALKPFATAYASPLPFTAWGRLVKARFTTGPGPGTTWNLCVGLGQADLYTRSVQTSEHHSLAAASSEKHGPVVVPDTEVVLEVPTDRFSRPLNSPPQASNSTYRVAEKNIELHTALHELLQDDPHQNPTNYQLHVSLCISLLNRRLANGPGDDQRFRISVDSFAPLSALNALRLHGPATKLVLDRCQDNHDDAWLPCEQWQRTLWPETRSSAEGTGGSPVVLLSSVNVDEKLLTLHFFNLQDQLLTAFDLVVPSAGLEQRWWQWIYDEIQRCHGSVLSSHSTARCEGRWAALSVVAAYSATRTDEAIESWTDVPPTDIGRLLTSFRNLQGQAARDRSRPGRNTDNDAFQSLREEIGTEALAPQNDGSIAMTKADNGWLRARVAHHCLDDDALATAQLIQRPRLDSTLKNVKVWYRKPVEASSRYTSRFGRNPFSFTRPLTLKDYEALYGSFDKMRELDSRARLADRLASHLCSSNSENIVLVGAYRSGKTTIMNMVVDLINVRHQEIDPVIAVRINTAVTPPEQLFLAAYQEILNLQGKWAPDSPQATAVNLVKDAGAKIAGSFYDVFKSNASLEVEFALPFLKSLRLATTERVKTVTAYIRELEQRQGQEAMSDMENTGLRAARLRASMTLLKKLLRDASQEGKRFKIVIALDEVADASTWGANFAFPAWRQLIEDPGLPEARWLFSSTRQLAVSTGYSPLGNAMREYNMEPLRDVEAEAFLNAFDSFDPKWWDASLSAKARLRPVVTFHARKRIIWLAGNQPYLMQVVCCHLFDECIKNSVPILTGRLVREIVENRILSELSDFFLGQWRTLDSEHATAILRAVEETASGLDLWRHCPDDRQVRFKCSAEVQKSLERAGLGSQQLQMVFVPLFVMWIQEHFATSRTRRTRSRGTKGIQIDRPRARDT